MIITRERKAALDVLGSDLANKGIKVLKISIWKIIKVYL